MEKINFFNIRKERISFLLENSLIAIPFNIILASLLAADLIYNGSSPKLVLFWVLWIYLTIGIRWFFCKHSITKKLHKDTMRSVLIIHFFLTLLMGVAWGSCYLLFLSSATELEEFTILLVLGGMCAGSVASFSVYLPVYFAYILPILLPVVIYNYYIFTFDRVVLASTFLLFIVMLSMLAKLNGRLVIKIVELSDQKELLIKKLEFFSITDPLTNLYNRRHFNTILQQEFDRARRNKYPLILITLDVDNFKTVNDILGHPTGDKLLINTAGLLKTTFQRAGDTVFRLGGDEFAVIIANMPLKEIVPWCELVQKNFKQNHRAFQKINSEQAAVFNKVTLSMGIAYIPFTSSSNIEEAILTADKALYQAKEQGTNKIILSELH